MAKQKSGPVDIIIGQKIKNRRVELGLSQQQVADHLGVSFQQVQKYERGYNRISSSKLHILAKILHMPLSYFFSEDSDYNFSKDVLSHLADSHNNYETLSEIEKIQLEELIECFNNIKDHKLRQNILNLAKSLGNY